jgi:hypothetical protein
MIFMDEPFAALDFSRAPPCSRSFEEYTAGPGWEAFSSPTTSTRPYCWGTISASWLTASYPGSFIRTREEQRDLLIRDAIRLKQEILSGLEMQSAENDNI